MQVILFSHAYLPWNGIICEVSVLKWMLSQACNQGGFEGFG